MAKKYLRFKPLQKKLGDCGRSSVYRWVEQGILPRPLKIGGINVWDEDEVDAHLAQQRSAVREDAS